MLSDSVIDSKPNSLAMLTYGELKRKAVFAQMTMVGMVRSNDSILESVFREEEKSGQRSRC